MVMLKRRTWKNTEYPELASKGGQLCAAKLKDFATLAEVFDIILFVEIKFPDAVRQQADMFCEVISLRIRDVPVDATQRETLYDRARRQFATFDKSFNVTAGYLSAWQKLRKQLHRKQKDILENDDNTYPSLQLLLHKPFYMHADTKQVSGMFLLLKSV